MSATLPASGLNCLRTIVAPQGQDQMQQLAVFLSAGGEARQLLAKSCRSSGAVLVYVRVQTGIAARLGYFPAKSIAKHKVRRDPARVLPMVSCARGMRDVHFPACSRAYGLGALWQLAEICCHTGTTILLGTPVTLATAIGQMASGDRGSQAVCETAPCLEETVERPNARRAVTRHRRIGARTRFAERSFRSGSDQPTRRSSADILPERPALS